MLLWKIGLKGIIFRVISGLVDLKRGGKIGREKGGKGIRETLRFELKIFQYSF